MRIPFTLDAWLKDKSQKVITRNNRPAEIIHIEDECADDLPIIALVGEKPYRATLNYTIDGIPESEDEDRHLFIVTPEPEMSEMEISLLSWLSDDTSGEIPMERMKQVVKARVAELLDLAKQQLLQSGELLTQEHHEKLMKTLREECKKDLPRWRIWRNGACGGSDGHPIALVHGAGGIRFVSCLGANGEKYIMLSDIEKLPGFEKEDYE